MSPTMSLAERPTRMAENPGKADKTVRIDKDVAEMADFVVARRRARGQKSSLQSYLSPILRAQVEADYASEVEAQYHESRELRKKKDR